MFCIIPTTALQKGFDGIENGKQRIGTTVWGEVTGAFYIIKKASNGGVHN